MSYLTGMGLFQTLITTLDHSFPISGRRVPISPQPLHLGKRCSIKEYRLRRAVQSEPTLTGLACLCPLRLSILPSTILPVSVSATSSVPRHQRSILVALMQVRMVQSMFTMPILRLEVMWPFRPLQLSILNCTSQSYLWQQVA